METSPEGDAETDSTRGHTMYAYEFSQLRSAELIRRAEHERLAREAVRDRRAARREKAERAADGEASTGRPRRHRFPRTA